MKTISGYKVFSIYTIICLVIYFPYINNLFYLDDYTWFVILQYKVKFNYLTGFWDIGTVDLNSIIGVWWADANQDFAKFFRPLFTLIFSLFYDIFGKGSALPLHILSVILHIVVSFLTYKLCLKLSKNQFISLLAGIIFIICPQLTMTVAWISNSTDLYAALFMLSSLLLYIRYREKGNIVNVILSNIFIVLAMMSKEIAIIVPLAFIVYEYIFTNSININGIGSSNSNAKFSLLLRNWKHWMPSLIILILYLTFYIAGGFGTNNLYYHSPFNDTIGYLKNFLVGLPIIMLGYITNFPISLTMYMNSTIPWLAAAGILVLIIFIFALYPYRSIKLIQFCFGMFLISLIPQFGTEASPRLMYIPMIFGSCIVSFLIFQINPLKKKYFSEINSNKNILSNPFGYFLILVMIILALTVDFSSVRTYKKTLTYPDKIFEESKVYVDNSITRDVVYLNSPSFLYCLYAYDLYRIHGYGQELHLLSSFNGKVWVRQISNNTIQLRTDKDGWLTNIMALVLRKNPELRVGQKFETGLITAAIESVTSDKKDVLQVKFEFKKNLNDPSVLLLYYDGNKIKKYIFDSQYGEWILLGDSSDALKDLM